jgi:hypothetical protein
MAKIGFELFLSPIGMACLLLDTGPAYAQNTRSWVSGAGSDAAACTRLARRAAYAHCGRSRSGVVRRWRIAGATC